MATSTIRELIVKAVKAAKAEKSEDAMRFTQAACNAANALQVLAHTEIATKGAKT